MAIDWREAPEWANYAAMNADCCWFWYENEPKIDYISWCFDGGRFEFIFREDWRQSLTKRPEVSE